MKRTVVDNAAVHKSNAPPPKHIVISHVYSSDNKGDAALTSVLIKDLKRVFPDAQLSILRFESVVPGMKFEGVPEYPNFMFYAVNKYRNPLGKLLYALYMMSATLLWAWWFRLTGRRLYLPRDLRDVVNRYVQADLIVPVGGGYIRSRTGLLNRMNIPLILHPLLVGALLGKPTVLYSQSVGPFVHGYERPLVAFVLRRMTLIMLREDTSRELLEQLGVTQNVVRSVDAGFLLASPDVIDLRKTYHIPKNQLIVGVTVRSWLIGEHQTNYERAVAMALDAIIASHSAQVIFIPQVTAAKGDDDRLTSFRVLKHMRHKKSVILIEDEPDHHHIKAMYSGLDVLLGTRFHSVIFSLTSYVPVMAIEYEHKTSGIMRDLGLEKWVMKIEDVTAPKLTRTLNDLLRHQDEYRATLRQRLPAYVKLAEQTASLVAKSYHGKPLTAEP